MRRSYSPSSSSFSFGPGPLSTALKALIGANVALFIIQVVFRSGFRDPITELFGLQPIATVQALRVWQVVTYMFLHAGPFHILFNMLSLWMFGVELERRWGSRFFTRYYFICGIGAAIGNIMGGIITRRDFASRVGLVMGMYVGVMSISSSTAAMMMSIASAPHARAS